MTPFLRRKDTGKTLSDQCVSWTGWNVSHGMSRLTPISSGAYLQKTASGVLQCQATFRFAFHFPDSSVDDYFEVLELARRHSSLRRSELRALA